ncbi:MAG: hypothetical protein U0527_06280 [Candidatus Eisenbacteria bacterium]
MRKLLLASAMVVLGATIASYASAGVTAGTMGLGFISADAPIGGRYVVNEKMALDVGIGFAKQSDDSDTKNVDEGTTDFNLNVGVPILMHDAGKAMLWLRPGIGISNTSYDAEGVDSNTDTSISGLLVVEVPLTDNFTVSAAHGLVINLDPTNISTAGLPWTGVGFMYYFVK